MKVNYQQATYNLRSAMAFTLIEVLIAVGIVGIAFVSLYGGVASGFALINNARENLRATQIMLERVEIMRLYTWEQINAPGFIPSTFSASYYPSFGTTNDQSSNVVGGGLVYYGTVQLSTAPVATAYSNNMKLVTVNIKWTNGIYKHSRSMETLVSENGLQKYVY